MNPKLLLPALLTPLLLTGCSMNAPMQIPVDIHDNTINTGPTNGNENPSGNNYNNSNPFQTTDPNAPQDIPDSWSEDSVDTPEPVPLPTPQG
jgi:hypothetical protein